MSLVIPIVRMHAVFLQNLENRDVASSKCYPSPRIAPVRTSVAAVTAVNPCEFTAVSVLRSRFQSVQNSSSGFISTSGKYRNVRHQFGDPCPKDSRATPE